MNSKKITLVPLIFSVVSQGAFAVTIPNISDAVRQAEPPKLPQKEAPALPEFGGRGYPEPMKEIGGKKVYISGFKIIGNKKISTKDILGAIEDYKNKEMSLSDMEKVASEITKYYRTKGFFVARAYIPAQEIEGGILKITIVAGTYGKLNLDNKSLVNNKILQNILDEAKKDEIVSTASLERAMLLINDTPGSVVTSAEVFPGERVGESDFSMGTQATSRFGGYVLADNYGGKYTGRNKLSIGVNANSPFGFGDKFAINGILSEQNRLKNAKASYSSWLSSNGLRGEISAARTAYSLGEDYKDLDAIGSADTLEAKLSYPFIKTRIETLDGFVSVDKKKMKDEIKSTSTATDKAANVVNVGLNYQKSLNIFGLRPQASVSAALSAGKLYFRDDTAKSNDDAGAKTSGNYYKLSVEATANTELSNNFSLSKTLKIQKALGGKNLDGSEDMSFTGQSGVKAYPEGEFSSETGYLLNIELFYALPSFGKYEHKVGLFFDGARGYAERAVTDNYGRGFYGSGFGYYANYAGGFLKAQIAQRLGGTSVISESSDVKTRFLWQAGWSF